MYMYDNITFLVNGNHRDKKKLNGVVSTSYHTKAGICHRMYNICIIIYMYIYFNFLVYK